MRSINWFLVSLPKTNFVQGFCSFDTFSGVDWNGGSQEFTVRLTLILVLPLMWFYISVADGRYLPLWKLGSTWKKWVFNKEINYKSQWEKHFLPNPKWRRVCCCQVMTYTFLDLDYWQPISFSFFSVSISCLRMVCFFGSSKKDLTFIVTS